MISEPSPDSGMKQSNTKIIRKPIIAGLVFGSALSVTGCKPAAAGVESVTTVDRSTDSLWGRGKMVFERECVKCHQIDGVGAAIGPSLDQFRETMDGTMAREAIVEPGRLIKPGYQNVMPADFGQRLSEQQMDELIYFLTNK